MIIIDSKANLSSLQRHINVQTYSKTNTHITFIETLENILRMSCTTAMTNDFEKYSSYNCLKLRFVGCKHYHY